MRGQIGRYMITACLVMVSASVTGNRAIKEKDLKHLLSSAEWKTLIGKKDENFTVTYPLHTPPQPDNQQGFHQIHQLHIEAPSFGKTFSLDLLPTTKLISSDFVVLETNSNGSVPLSIKNEDLGCYYRGTNSALSLCYGVRGIVHSNDEHYYLIHPLPKRFHNASLIPHILLKKLHQIEISNDYYKLKNSLNKQSKLSSKNSHNREVKQSVDNENFIILNETYNISKLSDNGDLDKNILIEKTNHEKTRRDYLKDLQLQIPNNKGPEVNHVIIKAGQKDNIGDKNVDEISNEINLGYSLSNSRDLTKTRENIPASTREKLDYLNEFRSNNTKDNKLEAVYSPKKTRNTKLKRAKREVFPIGATAFVETAVFVDRDLFDHMKTNFPVDTEREIIRFVLAMINAVQLLYHDSSLGRPVNFVLKRLEIMKEDVAGLMRPPDIDRFLSNFCNWQRTKNPAGDREPLHWDHALILTGLDLYVRGKHGKISNQVVGLAPVAGMCTATSSCTVNEGRHFESVYVVAHEIGHNLGMRHDGPLADNDCDPSSYIMSPTLGSGKITWSPCSKRYLQKFLETPQSRCLLDHGSSAGQLDHGAEGALPGERFNTDQQCMLKYGRGSKHSSQQSLDDVCRDLHCERERYTWTSHPALEGTHCGSGMWCRGGRCIRQGSHPNQSYSSALKQSPKEQVNGGWSKWRQGECASGCLFGEEGRLRSGSTGILISERFCNNPRPEGMGEKCEGPEKMYQTCNAQQCLNVPRLTIREFAEQICTRAKEVDKDLTGSGMQKISSDPEEACVVWCQKRNGSTKSRGWTFPDGTACQTRRNRYGRTSYCINGRCEDFVCDPLEESVFAQMPDLCPNDRDNNEITWRTGLRRREGVIRWKSASGCHYNCISPGSGIRLVMNKKLGKSSIQLCQPDQIGCGKVKSPFQHASLICSKYKDRVRRLSGLGMQISASSEDPDRPCRVACQDEKISYRFYLVNGQDGWFPFGTDCSKGSTEKKAVCISGKCLAFGSDDTPLSESEFTLPLLSRTKRSLEKNHTKVTVKLNQEELDAIVEKFNRTLSGITDHSMKLFDIDYNNPVHIHKDSEAKPYDQYYGQDYDLPTDQDILNYT